MLDLFINFDEKEFGIETVGNYIQCSFKYFEQCISHRVFSSCHLYRLNEQDTVYQE